MFKWLPIYSGVGVILALKNSRNLENYPDRHKLPQPTWFLRSPKSLKITTTGVILAQILCKFDNIYELKTNQLHMFLFS